MDSKMFTARRVSEAGEAAASGASKKKLPATVSTPVLLFHVLSKTRYAFVEKLDYNLDLKGLLDHISRVVFAAVAPGGDACGNTAALSLGEPSTQLTLNSFHTAGTSHASVTLGVPRLKEVISCAKTLATPQTILEFASDKSESELRRIAARLPLRRLKDVVTSRACTSLSMLPSLCSIEIADDINLTLRIEAIFSQQKEVTEALENSSSAVIVYCLNKQLLKTFDTTPQSIAKRLHMDGALVPIACHFNAQFWWLLLLPTKSFSKAELLRLSHSIAAKSTINGVEGVKAAEVTSVERWDERFRKNVGESNPDEGNHLRPPHSSTAWSGRGCLQTISWASLRSLESKRQWP